MAYCHPRSTSTIPIRPATWISFRVSHARRRSTPPCATASASAPRIRRWSVAGSTDVVGVGAGPAGSIAALILARAGASVRLIDRAGFPRDKLCGDTVNPGSLALLDRLD